MILLSLMFLLLAAAVNPAQSQEIQITGDSVIMTCTGGEDGSVKWSKDSNIITAETKLTYTVKEQQGTVEGFFICEYEIEGETRDTKEDIKHKFYLKVKVCENCYELSGLRVWGVIMGDLLITGAVIVIVYTISTKNSGGTQKKASNSRSLNPPQPPNPDYAPLDPKTRNNAVYSGIR